MQSPIPSRFWIGVFYGTTVSLATLCTISLFRRAHADLSPVWSQIHQCSEGGAPALDALTDAAESEQRTQGGHVSLVLSRPAAVSMVLKHLQLPESPNDRIGHETSDPEMLLAITNTLAALRLVRSAYAYTPELQDAFANKGGPLVLLRLLNRAQGLEHDLLETETLRALEAVVKLDLDDIILPCDVPVGSKSALSLARLRGFHNFLQLLDDSSTVEDSEEDIIQSVGLPANGEHILGIISFVSALRIGTQALLAGTSPNKSTHSSFSSVVDFLLHFVQPTMHPIASLHAIKAIAGFALHSPTVPKHFHAPHTVSALVQLLQLTTIPPELLVASLKLVMILIEKRQDTVFADLFVQEEGCYTVLQLMCVSDEADVRSAGEEVVGSLLGLETTVLPMYTSIQQNASIVKERQARDEAQARAEQQQRMRQQQLMQMMMGGGGGADGAAF